MKTIPLTKGKVALVDDEDYENLSKIKWCVSNKYALGRVNRRLVLMHTYLLGKKKGLEIDKDMKGNGLLYSPETCSIITHKQNANSRRNHKYLEFKGETKTLAQWADFYNIHQRTLRNRIIRGWNINLALTLPIQKYGGHKKHKKIINYAFGFIG